MCVELGMQLRVDNYKAAFFNDSSGADLAIAFGLEAALFLPPSGKTSISFIKGAADRTQPPLSRHVAR